MHLKNILSKRLNPDSELQIVLEIMSLNSPSKKEDKKKVISMGLNDYKTNFST